MILLVLSALLTGAVFSEDLTCAAAGLMVAQGRLGFVPAFLACLVGIVLGDVLMFAAGRYLGRPALRRAPFRWFLHEDMLARASSWLAGRAATAAICGRLVPGARGPLFFAAGVLDARTRALVGWYAATVTLWTAVLVGVVATAGTVVFDAAGAYWRAHPVAIVAGALAIAFFGGRITRFLSRRFLRASPAPAPPAHPAPPDGVAPAPGAET